MNKTDLNTSANPEPPEAPASEMPEKTTPEQSQTTAPEQPPEKPKKKWKKAALWTAFILFNLASMAYILLNDFVFNRVEVSPSIGPVLAQNWWFFLLALLASGAFLMFKSAIHAAMMHLYTGKTRFRMCMATTLIGTFYDSVTPLSTGGQPFQIHYLQKKNVPEGTSITLPIVEYVLNRFTFVLLSIAALILCAVNAFGSESVLAGADKAVVIGLFAAASVGIALNFGLPLLLLLSLFSQKACRAVTRFIVRLAKFFKLTKDPDKLYANIMHKLDANTECMKMLIKRKRVLLCVLFSICGRLALASVSYFVLKAFGYVSPHTAGWVEIVTLTLLVANSVSFIPTPGNSGAMDLSFYWVFNTAILAATGIMGVGSFATLCWRFIFFYLPFLVSLFTVLVTWKRKNNN